MVSIIYDQFIAWIASESLVSVFSILSIFNVLYLHQPYFIFFSLKQSCIHTTDYDLVVWLSALLLPTNCTVIKSFCKLHTHCFAFGKISRCLSCQRRVQWQHLKYVNKARWTAIIQGHTWVSRYLGCLQKKLLSINRGYVGHLIHV